MSVSQLEALLIGCGAIQMDFLQSPNLPCNSVIASGPLYLYLHGNTDVFSNYEVAVQKYQSSKKSIYALSKLRVILTSSTFRK